MRAGRLGKRTHRGAGSRDRPILQLCLAKPTFREYSSIVTDITNLHCDKCWALLHCATIALTFEFGCSRSVEEGRWEEWTFEAKTPKARDAVELAFTRVHATGVPYTCPSYAAAWHMAYYDYHHHCLEGIDEHGIVVRMESFHHVLSEEHFVFDALVRLGDFCVAGFPPNYFFEERMNSAPGQSTEPVVVYPVVPRLDSLGLIISNPYRAVEPLDDRFPPTGRAWLTSCSHPMQLPSWAKSQVETSR
jgi:hypothetical protein